MKGFKFNIINQAKELAARLEQTKEELANKTLEVTVGGGMVTVKVNGQQQVLNIEVQDEVFHSGDKQMMIDLIVAGVNEALRQSSQMAAEEMSKLTGGLKIPGLT